MIETTASLQRQINSAHDLQSVVRSMKAMAASNIVHYEQSVQALAQYRRTVEAGLGVCFRASSPEPGIAPPEAAVRHAVVFGSDQGLVGRFNDTVADQAVAILGPLPGKVRLWAVGERVHHLLAEAGLPLAGTWPVPVSVQAITPLVSQILVSHDTHHDPQETASLHLFYNRPATAGSYQPVHQRLLPLDEAWHKNLAAQPWSGSSLPEILGQPTTTLRTLVREYLFVSLFRASAESLASENASRLAAMERADRNINQLLTDFQSAFHRLRQDQIDAELFDVLAGFEALNPRRSDLPSGRD